MKVSFEIPRNILCTGLIIFVIGIVAISGFVLFGPRNARAEWNSESISSSDSYTLSDIEKHLGDLVRQMEKLNGNLSGIEDELEKIRNNM